jgi:hypothetical protein
MLYKVPMYERGLTTFKRPTGVFLPLYYTIHSKKYLPP